MIGRRATRNPQSIRNVEYDWTSSQELRMLNIVYTVGNIKIARQLPC